MKKILGLVFVGLFLLSIMLSTSPSITARFQNTFKAEKYSLSTNPIKMIENNNLAKNK
jgi:hypothetical protein